MKKILVLLITFFLFTTNAYALNEVNIYMFYKTGCSKCASAEEKLQNLQRYYPNISIYKILESENEPLYNFVINNYNLTRTGLPLVVIGDHAILGYAPGRETTYEKYIRTYSTTEYKNEVGDMTKKTYNKNYSGSLRENPIYMDEDDETVEVEEEVKVKSDNKSGIIDILPILSIGVICGLGALIVLIKIINNHKKNNESFDEDEFLKEMSTGQYYGSYDDPLEIKEPESVTNYSKEKVKKRVLPKNKLNKNEIRNIIPDYDQDLYEDKLFKVYETIQNNLMMDNIKAIKYLVTDEMFKYYALALNTIKTKNQQSVLSNIKLFDSKFVSIKEVKDKIEIVMYLQIKCKNYVLDKTTNNIIKGNYKNLASTYKLVFIKETNREVNEICPNCGSSIINTNRCEYCNTKIDNYSDFVLAKETLIERKVIDGD